MSPPPTLSRRALTLGGIAAASAALLAGALYEVPRLLRHRATGAYADLVNRLSDVDQAAVIGRALASQAGTDSGASYEALASDLRAKLRDHSLAELSAHDAREGTVEEADGWVMPATVLSLCQLAVA